MTVSPEPPLSGEEFILLNEEPLREAQTLASLLEFEATVQKLEIEPTKRPLVQRAVSEQYRVKQGGKRRVTRSAPAAARGGRPVAQQLFYGDAPAVGAASAPMRAQAAAVSGNTPRSPVS